MPISSLSRPSPRQPLVPSKRLKHSSSVTDIASGRKSGPEAADTGSDQETDSEVTILFRLLFFVQSGILSSLLCLPTIVAKPCMQCIITIVAIDHR